MAAYLLCSLYFPRLSTFLQTPLLRMKVDAGIVGLRLRWFTATNLLAQIAYKGNAGEWLLTAHGSRFLIIMVNLRKLLVKRLVLRGFVEFCITVPFMNVHGQKVARTYIESDTKSGKQRGAARIFAPLYH